MEQYESLRQSHASTLESLSVAEGNAALSSSAETSWLATKQEMEEERQNLRKRLDDIAAEDMLLHNGLSGMKREQSGLKTECSQRRKSIDKSHKKLEVSEAQRTEMRKNLQHVMVDHANLQQKLDEEVKAMQAERTASREKLEAAEAQ